MLQDVLASNTHTMAQLFGKNGIPKSCGRSVNFLSYSMCFMRISPSNPL